MMKNEEFLTELLSEMTVSGCENKAEQVIRRNMEETVDQIRTDEIGDTVCVLNPEEEFKILLTAHIDEIGLVVTDINDQGRLIVLERGGIVPATYLGRSVKITGNQGLIYGVVESHNSLFKKEGGVKTSDLLVDIGAESREEALKLVSLGAAIVLDTDIRKLAGGRFSARALDDRLGVFIIMEAMKRAKEKGCRCGVYCGATVGEETAMNGAYWTASRVKPNLAMAVDVTYTSDHVGMKNGNIGTVKLGGGPVICNGTIIVRSLNERLRSCALKCGITVQTEAISRLSGTDADKMHFAGEGIPTVLVSIPLRFMHHPAEVADEKDVEGCIELIAEFLCSY